MRHVRKLHPCGCGVAVAAMLCGISYTAAREGAPGGKAYDFNTCGIWVGQLVSMLKRLAPEQKWRIIGRSTPVPFRHYTPRITSGAIILTRLTGNGTVFVHYVAYDRGWLLDPDSDGRIRLSDAKCSKDWRSWLVLSEITDAPTR